MNTLKSFNAVDIEKNEVNLLETQRILGFTIPLSFSRLLTEYNVAKPKLTYFKSNNIEFNINYFFGFSENKHEDFLYNYKSYVRRMPKELFPIASVDGGDLLCMGKLDANIFYWFHEKDDLGIRWE